MATIIGKLKVLTDAQVRVTAAVTTQGTAQAKGTATDMLVTIIAGPDGATAVAGSTVLAVQGSNVTATATSNWTTVVADKGTIAAVTASGVQNLHFAQLQYKFYQLAVTAATTATNNLSVVWNFGPVADSFDATVA